jgi:ribosomal protein L21E
MIRQHAAKPSALNGKTVGEMIVEEHAYAMALRMTIAARNADRAHRLQMDALLSASAAVAGSTSSTFGITLALRNKTARTIKTLDCGVEVREAGIRLGTAEFDVNQAVAPRAQAHIAVVLPYAKFGGDAGTIRNARGKHLHVLLDVKEIGYAGGGTAGAGD